MKYLVGFFITFACHAEDATEAGIDGVPLDLKVEYEKPQDDEVDSAQLMNRVTKILARTKSQNPKALVADRQRLVVPLTQRGALSLSLGIVTISTDRAHGETGTAVGVGGSIPLTTGPSKGDR